MESGQMDELTSREALTLIQIANGWDGAAPICESDVSRLQALGFIEQRGTSIGLTASGRQRIVRLRRA
jgi:hypothetical protein